MAEVTSSALFSIPYSLGQSLLYLSSRERIARLLVCLCIICALPPKINMFVSVSGLYNHAQSEVVLLQSQSVSKHEPVWYEMLINVLYYYN